MKIRWPLIYGITIVVVAALTVGVVLLLQNINQRKQEARQDVFRVVDITEGTIDPTEWGKNFPRQYDGYRRTVDTVRTRHGGSEAFQKLDEDPVWRTIFAGYAFGVDYREERSHAYMLADQDITERIKVVKQPGSCLHCHAAVLPAYYQAGVGAGAPTDETHRQEAILTGFEIVSSMPYTDARKLVDHPVTCGDCHDPNNMQLRVTRPGFLYGIQTLARSTEPTPHLPSIERWRSDGRQGDFDVNSMASRQELRSFVCGQCHVEYYFKGEGKIVTYPWHNGLKVEEIEAYYNTVGHKDWVHKLSGAPVLKAQHPEFELWSQGIHARSGVACADCHMPYKREGAIKISDHHIRSPLLNVASACQTCHNFPEEEMKARAEAIQDRTQALMDRAEEAVKALIEDLQEAQAASIPADQLAAAQEFQRKAQWRLDFIAAENSMGFHAPQEAARILGEAIDYARQGQLEVAPRPHNLIRRHPIGTLGLCIVLLVILMAIFAPWVAVYDPAEQAAKRLLPPSADHFMGTDELGRDVFSRVVYAARTSLYIGVLAVGLALVLGVSAGVLAGFLGGKFDSAVVGVMDILFAFPTLVLAIVITGLLGPSLTNAMLAIGVVYSPTFARVARAAVLTVKNEPYIEAARVVGGRELHIIMRHILPNILAPQLLAEPLLNEA